MHFAAAGSAAVRGFMSFGLAVTPTGPLESTGPVGWPTVERTVDSGVRWRIAPVALAVRA
jgi:hypothetical protein